MTPTALAVAALCVTAGLLPAQQDTSTYADSATAVLVARARTRHARQDSLVRDYRATVVTRLDFSVGRSRFARQLPLVAHETTARVTWREPNDLRVELLGARTRVSALIGGSRSRGRADRDPEVEVSFGGRPWFVPRALGDSIRLLGLPETAALHPLSPGAERWYRYAITDSATVSLPGRMVRAIAIRVEPKALGPSLVAGDIWVDAESADVVRLMVRFVGEYLWETPDGDTPHDSAAARKGSRWAQRFLSVDADLEYALLENRYWMPYRQMLDLTAEVNILVHGAAPLRTVTTFKDYEINTSAPLVFSAPADTGARGEHGRLVCPACGPDSARTHRPAEVGYLRTGTWSGGRWEVDVPPRDSLAAYPWRDTLQLEQDPVEAERIRQTVADLGRLSEQLPDAFLGRQRFGLSLEQLGGIARFNRVQGFSAGLGFQLRPGPSFTTLLASGRYGFADQRLTGALTWRREAPDGVFQAGVFRSVLETEPWSRGLTFGNTLNAVFAGHDDADYYLAAWGGRIAYTPYHGPLGDVDLAVSYERQRSMVTEAGSAVNDFLGGSGVMPPNPEVVEGDFARALVSPRRRFGATEVRLGLEGLVGESGSGMRGWATVQIPFVLLDRTGTLSLKSGYALGDGLPQLRFRAGGPGTVRGYDYGTRVGAGVWSAQLDMALTRSWLLAPVIFADVGDTFRSGSFDPLVGVGGGISLLGGWIRLNGSVGLNPSNDFRFDLLFRAPR
jgi:hypothetical protein